jgi:hypothetical protein
MAVVMYARTPTRQVPSFVLLGLMAAPILTLVVPTLYLVSVALTWRRAPLICAAVVVLLGSLVPQMRLITSGRPWRWAGAAVLCGIALTATAVSQNGASSYRPRGNHLFYAVDADAGVARWASADAATDEWTTQFLGSRPQRASLADHVPD